MNTRPQRLKIIDELRLSKSLPSGEKTFEPLGTGQRVVIIGLGPDPAIPAKLLQNARDVAFIECPAVEAQMPDGWRQAIPEGWKRLEHAVFDPRDVRVLVYTPAARLFPSFYGPLLARVRLAVLSAVPPATGKDLVWLPAKANALLVRELDDAFSGLGLRVERLDAEQAAAQIPAMLRERAPALYFSINFAGLDPHGELFHLLAAAGSRVAVWCVDNPFHLLSGLKSPYWRDVELFVTDASFVRPLREHGALRVHHLPLGAWDGFARAKPEFPDLAGRLVFVGRSAFPGKAGFFAGCQPPPELLAEAQAMLQRGERPDFWWWTKRLETGSLWPGREVRTAGCGAEHAGLTWRGLCLANAGPELTVFGDAGWREALPGADLRPEVDYYGPLAAMYASAGAVLGCTSPLLPAGLTQRHFDVWAAGGLLLSDSTPGLDIFPPELTREIVVRKAQNIEPLFRRFMTDARLRDEVINAWRAHVLADHNYVRRATQVLEIAAGAGFFS